MNYRHAYHAGSHADVLKHVVFVRAIERLKLKPKPFRVIDAHAGAGLYDLGGPEAFKTGEWQTGIGKLAEPFAPEVEALLEPYRRITAELKPRYPGSPDLAARLMREQDRLTANELHPEDFSTLSRHFRYDPRVTVTGVDARACLAQALPPSERRGLVLIDPPYEQVGEAEQAVKVLAAGVQRFATGVFMLWFPLKADGLAENLTDAVAALAIPGTLLVRMRIKESFKGGGLAGSGVIVVNPPWKLDEDLRILVPPLTERLALGNWGQSSVDWLLPPR